MQQPGQISIAIDNELIEQFDYEGLLVHPIKPQLAMLIMSSKDNNFTLRIFKMELKNGIEYQIIRN